MASLEVRYSYTDPLAISREKYRDLADLWQSNCIPRVSQSNHINQKAPTIKRKNDLSTDYSGDD